MNNLSTCDFYSLVLTDFRYLCWQKAVWMLVAVIQTWASSDSHMTKIIWKSFWFLILILLMTTPPCWWNLLSVQLGTGFNPVFKRILEWTLENKKYFRLYSCGVEDFKRGNLARGTFCCPFVITPFWLLLKKEVPNGLLFIFFRIRFYLANLGGGVKWAPCFI